ncbi:MAG: hypothetical protein Q7N95_07345, partial [Alphaproteobacteria bacterium]|nr:hypothetical protein [Alphaproteobacteria bacterium]
MTSAPVAHFTVMKAVLRPFFLMVLAMMATTPEGAIAQESSSPPPPKIVKMSQFSPLTGPVRLTDAAGA